MLKVMSNKNVTELNDITSVFLDWLSDGINDGEDEEVTVEEEVVEEKVSLLIISGRDSESDARKGLALFEDNGDYELTKNVRNEDMDVEDVVVMYSGNVNQSDVRDVEKILQEEFDNVQTERDDEEVSKYNHDIVVVIGSPKDDEGKD